MRAVKLGGPEADEQALRRFVAAVEIDPTLWEAWHNLGVIYARQGDDAGAQDAFERALKVNPAHTASLLAQAESARRARRFGAAKKGYQEALARDPDDAATRLRLASLLRETGEIDRALEQVREALRKQRPGSQEGARAYVELGLLYLAAGRHELAELVLTKATQLDPKSPVAWNALALVSLRRGNDQQAFERFDHATSLDPGYHDARFNKASVLLDAGDYRSAVVDLEAVLAAAPDDVDARIALGIAYRGLGEYDRALGTWDRVLKTAPRHPDALWNVAVLQMDFKRDESKARDALARYLQAAPEDHPRRKDAQARMKELGGTKK
jgi:Tfp pilus assembly protein PilF